MGLEVQGRRREEGLRLQGSTGRTGDRKGLDYIVRLGRKKRGRPKTT